MKKFNFKKSGFTLIELIVVIAIIGILIAITVPRLSTYIQAAQVTAEQAGAKTVYSAAVAYNTDKGDGSGGIQTGYLTTAMLGEFLDANATIVDDSSKVTKRGEYAVHVDTDGTYTVSYWDVSLTSASGKKGDVAKMVDGAFPTSSSSSSSSPSSSPSPSPTVPPDTLPL